MVPLLEVADPDIQVDIHLSDRRLFPIWDKVQAGQRLSSAEGSRNPCSISVSFLERSPLYIPLICGIDAWDSSTTMRKSPGK